MNKKDNYYNLKNFRNQLLVLDDQMGELTSMSAHMDDIYTDELNNIFRAVEDLKEKVFRGGEK